MKFSTHSLFLLPLMSIVALFGSMSAAQAGTTCPAHIDLSAGRNLNFRFDLRRIKGRANCDYTTRDQLMGGEGSSGGVSMTYDPYITEGVNQVTLIVSLEGGDIDFTAGQFLLMSVRWVRAVPSGDIPSLKEVLLPRGVTVGRASLVTTELHTTSGGIVSDVASRRALSARLQLP